MKEFIFNVNGYEVNACFDEDDIETVFKPLLLHWTSLQKHLNKRLLIGIGACPGSGKSTVVSFLEYLYQQMNLDSKLQAIGMDGFHYTNAYLKENHLDKEKGSANTFDVDKLRSKILETKVSNCFWPIYSRQIHDPIENQVYIDGDIILIEGNYLLSNDKNWNLAYLFDETMFIHVDIDELKPRLVERKAKGCSLEEAIKFYEMSDKKNVEYVLNHKIEADIDLYLKKNKIVKVSTKEK